MQRNWQLQEHYALAAAFFEGYYTKKFVKVVVN